MIKMTCVDLHHISTADSDSWPYTILDQFESLNSDIYKVLNTLTNQVLVLKQVSALIDEPATAITTEIDTVCRLNNVEQLRVHTDSIFRIFEFGTIDDTIFYTAPLYQESSPDQLNTSQQLELAFELLLAAVVLNLNGITHYDLHSGNILAEKVDYKRQYSINGQTYVCSSDFIPIIIDFGLASLGDPMPDLFEEGEILF